MLLTVREAAIAMGIDFHNVYYLVAMSLVDAVRIRGGIRIISESVEGFCAERENATVYNGTVPRYHGYRRCHEIIENFQKNPVPDDGGRTAERMEGRGRGMELYPKRHSRLPRQKLHDIRQLYFDFYEAG